MLALGSALRLRGADYRYPNHSRRLNELSHYIFFRIPVHLRWAWFHYVPMRFGSAKFDLAGYLAKGVLGLFPKLNMLKHQQMN